jgi:hypothetical protein
LWFLDGNLEDFRGQTQPIWRLVRATRLYSADYCPVMDAQLGILGRLRKDCAAVRLYVCEGTVSCAALYRNSVRNAMPYDFVLRNLFTVRFALAHQGIRHEDGAGSAFRFSTPPNKPAEGGKDYCGS